MNRLFGPFSWIVVLLFVTLIMAGVASMCAHGQSESNDDKAIDSQNAGISNLEGMAIAICIGLALFAIIAGISILIGTPK